MPTLDRNHYASAEGLRRGAYILAEAENGRPELILIATGSEVNLIVEARQQLQKQDIQTRLVSMPSWELFDTQTEEYRRSIFPPSVRARLAVEAGATQGWHRYIGEGGDVIGIDHFGASAPGPVLMREFGFTAENVCKRARALLGETMPDRPALSPVMPKRIGVAADHGGFALKEQLVGMLRGAGYEVLDFGDGEPKPDDDYPDFVVPLARAVARGEVDRGVAICGSGVGLRLSRTKSRGFGPA